VRIVAQVEVPAGQVLSSVSFFVDGKLVGMAEPGRYSAVDRMDENPFEQREILVQAADGGGRLISDTVVLPPFEVAEETEVRSILLEAGVYDKAGRFISDLEPSAFAARENGVPQKIDLVARETRRPIWCSLVDNSQSMSRTMDFVRLAAERLSSTLRQGDRVIVAPFNAHIGTITGPTNDGPTITQAIRVMRAAAARPFSTACGEHDPARERRRPPHHRSHHRWLRREQHDADRGRPEDRSNGSRHRLRGGDRRRGGISSEAQPC
jgi:hypothetical protein